MSNVIQRPLGAVERMYHRNMGDLSMLFTVAAEFSAPIAEEQVAAALAAVQKRHPLLQVHIEDHPETRLGFYRAEPVPPIALRVLRQPAETWRQAAAEEVSRRFDTSQAPLARAVLVGEGDRSVLLLTFYHCVVDGVGGMAVLNDVVRALGGQALETLPFPPAQEEQIAGALPAPTEHEAGPPPAEDPRMNVPVAARPSDGAVPSVATLALDTEFTQSLLRRSREEKTTVPSILVAAVSRARSVVGGEEYVRVLTPFDLRTRIGGDGLCVDYHSATRTGSEPFGGDTFWDQARAVGDALAGPRSAAGIAAGSAAIQTYVPVDVDAPSATAVMGSFAYDVLVSNLGVARLEGSVRPAAVWGPFLPCHLENEDLIGVITFGGQLRMVACGFASPDMLLTVVRDVLRTAVTEQS